MAEGAKDGGLNMTQEQQLLLKDLCGRVLYGTIGSYCWKCGESFDRELTGSLLEEFINSWNSTGDSEFEPYLRPMSSMTDEEKEEFEKVMKSCTEKILACPTNERWYQFFDAEEQDFMNAHHFDYRGLIPMGLALEAPEGMYKTK